MTRPDCVVLELTVKFILCEIGLNTGARVDGGVKVQWAGYNDLGCYTPLHIEQ